ncbi:MAG: HAD-IA family hydrolase [Lachnospiraceae bacterium]|nr:HAD-IA family hydrolase [Lachnospiraceae bacterium]
MGCKAVIFDMFETLVTLYRKPLYFSEQIAPDCGLSVAEFKALWKKSEQDRTLGKVDFEHVIEDILRTKNVYSKEVLEDVVRKRNESKTGCFETMDPEITVMFEELHKRGIKIGLITNCFIEEQKAIRAGSIIDYFDVACLSCEIGMAKPDRRIFEYCMDRLGLSPEECVYVGDGGSHELETAAELGMKALQATWYFADNTRNEVVLKPEFTTLHTPMEVLEYI